MDALQAYKYYLAVKIHFTTDYDLFKYKGRLKAANQDSFENRNDKPLFESLARKYPLDQELIYYFVSNFAYGHDEVLYEPEIGKGFYKNWIKRKESRTYIFGQDCNKILQIADNKNLTQKDIFSGNFPEVISMLLRNEISLESVAILETMSNFLDKDSNKDNIIIKDWRQRIIKTVPFIKFNINEINKIFLDFMENFV